MQNNSNINNKTDKCYAVHYKNNIVCDKKTCRNWIASEKNMNCAVIAANAGDYTLSEIGDLYGLTRMRICQIEKTICKKIKNSMIEK